MAASRVVICDGFRMKLAITISTKKRTGRNVFMKELNAIRPMLTV